MRQDKQDTGYKGDYRDSPVDVNTRWLHKAGCSDIRELCEYFRTEKRNPDEDKYFQEVDRSLVNATYRIDRLKKTLAVVATVGALIGFGSAIYIDKLESELKDLKRTPVGASTELNKGRDVPESY